MKVRELARELLQLPDMLQDAEVMYTNVSFEEGDEVTKRVNEVCLSSDGTVFLDSVQLGNEEGEKIGDYEFVLVDKTDDQESGESSQ